MMHRRSLLSLFLLALLPVTAQSAEVPKEKCLAILREGLRSEEFWPAMHAAEALTLAGEPEEVIAFLTSMQDEVDDDQQRCGVARELVRAGAREHAEIMLEILRGEDPYAHTHAAESLYKVGWDGDASVLEKAFAESDDLRLRLMAAAALGKHTEGEGRDKAFALIRETLRNESDPELYRVAAWILGRIGEPDDCRILRSRLDDAEDAMTRAYLHNSLAALGDEEGRRELRANLESDDPDIRTYAAVFAGDAGMSEAIPALIDLLDDEDLDVRVRAAQSLFVLSP